jgi:hypothetical protein
MTKRDIKTIIKQCYKGLPYNNALASVVYLACPELPVKDAGKLVAAMEIFHELYFPLHQNKENNK